MNGKDGGLENAQSGDTDDTRHSAQQRHEPSQTSGDKSSGGGASAMAPPPQALLGSGMSNSTARRQRKEKMFRFSWEGFPAGFAGSLGKGRGK